MNRYPSKWKCKERWCICYCLIPRIVLSMRFWSSIWKLTFRAPNKSTFFLPRFIIRFKTNSIIVQLKTNEITLKYNVKNMVFHKSTWFCYVFIIKLTLYIIIFNMYQCRVVQGIKFTIYLCYKKILCYSV